jgi:hypothetical protein
LHAYQNLQEGLGLRGADQQSARLFIHQKLRNGIQNFLFDWPTRRGDCHHRVQQTTLILLKYDK